MKRRTVILALVSLASAGCWPGPQEERIDLVEVKSSDIQPVSQGVRFAAIRDVALAPESVWVLDGAPPFVARITLSGGGAVQSGQRGQGPGEFLNPVAIQPAVDSGEPGAWVWDLGNHRVSVLDTLGALRVSEPLSDDAGFGVRMGFRQISYADPFRIRQNGSETLAGFFPRRLDRTGDLASGFLQRADRRLNPGLNLVRFSDHTDGGVSRFKEWTAVPLWDVCDRTVILWSPVSSQVIWFDLGGQKIDSVEVKGTSTPIQSPDIETYLERMARLELGPDYEIAGIDFAGMARAHRDRFADRHPGPTDIRCEPGGAAWLRLFDTSVDPLGRGQTWLRVSQRESPLKYSFPDEFTPAAFTAEGAYGVLEVREGYQQLAWWRRRFKP